jgi:D-serine deaminase-like pyridoxal phosphate-dependent protein
MRVLWAAMYLPPLGTRLEELDTPALVVDAAVLEQNIARMAEWSRQTGCAVRPHAKAHKTPLIARKQLEAGAIGICCAKLGEAEAMVAGGVPSVLITSELTGAAKLSRLIALARHAEVLVVVDDAANASELSRAATAAGLQLGVLVEVNVGQDRCGVAPGDPAADLAATVADLPGLRFAGLQGYEGNLQHVRTVEERRCLASMAQLLKSRRAVEARGLTVDICTTGGTGTHEIAGVQPGVTEVQPGSYIWMDADNLQVQGVPYAGGLTVLTTVISRQRSDAAIVDAGQKAISQDGQGGPQVKRAGLSYAPMGDEHGKLTGDALPSLGDVVQLVPSHCDTTVNLHDHLHVVRDGRLEAIWRIEGRGKVT